MSEKPRRLWVKTYLDHWAELALNQEFDLHIRVHFLALSKATPDNHVHFEPGEIRQSLEVVNKRTGETGPPERDKVSRAVNRAVALGLLAPGSNARCLVLPTGVEYNYGTVGKSCDRHGGFLAKETSERKVSLGRKQGFLAKETPDAVTCDDASLLLDILMEEVELVVDPTGEVGTGEEDEEVPSGGTSQSGTGEEDEGPPAPSEADLGWGDISDLPTPKPVPAAAELHCSRCDSKGHSFYDYDQCPLISSADAEADETDEAPEEPTVMYVGSGYGSGRRLATPRPSADEPQPYRPRWGRVS